MKTIQFFHRILAAILRLSAIPARGRVERNRRTRGASRWMVPLVALCCLANPLAADQFGKFTYTDDGTSITITDYPEDEVGVVVVPAMIIGKPVTQIGYGAFTYCTGLTEVIIPGSVTSIGEWTFGFCIKLTSVTIGSGVTSIGDGPFANCTNLTTIKVDPLNSTFSSASGVLYNKLRTLLILCPEGKAGNYSVPNSVTRIEDGAFAGCSRLTGITIPSSVTSIGVWTFGSCSSLISINIPGSVTSIGNGAFQGCSSLTTITIPTSVTSIGDGAFQSCSKLTNIAIPASVTFLGKEAFRECASLTSITIPGSVIGIGPSSFLFCAKMTRVTIGDGVQIIGNDAFMGCSSLASVTIPDSVTSVGVRAFNQCTGLTSVTIGNGVASIGGAAFGLCTSLTTVSIPDVVNSIGGSAFSGCSSLTTVKIGNGVASIGDMAFYECSSLTAITVDSLNSFYSSTTGVLFNKSQTLLIQYPQAKSGDYSVPSSTTTIGDAAFKYCAKLTSIAFPNSVTSIGNNAFGSCSSLTHVTIGSGVIGIGAGAFSICPGLTAITVDSLNPSYSVPDSVTTIGRYSFSYCAGLTRVEIGDGVTTIEDRAFLQSYNLTNVTLSESVTTIPDLAFHGCVSLTDIIIPSCVTRIGEWAFSACSKLTRVVFLGNAPIVPSNAFDYDTSGLIVYFSMGSTGFTSPTWGGHPSVPLAATREISITGPTGTQLTDGGTVIDCGTVNVGAKRIKIFTIINAGITELSGLAVINDGEHAANFIVTNPGANELSPAAKTTFTVTFNPGTSGLHTTTLHITSNDADESPFDITLKGTGITSPEIAIEEPTGKNLTDGVSSRSFGSVEVKSKVTKTFTIRNTGTANLKNLAVTMSGTNADNFAIKAPFKTTLVPGASTTFKVTIKPSVKGTCKAVIHIRSNDRDENPFDITLTGKGVASQPVAGLATSTISAPGIPSRSGGRIRSVDSTMQIHGKKYRYITIFRNGTADLDLEAVEVSSNLMDWFSGPKHTTVIENREGFLKVRDNTPIEPGKKRFIRVGRSHR